LKIQSAKNKQCKTCQQTLLITLFPKNKNVCKKCVSIRKKEIYNKENVKACRERQKQKNLVRMRCNAARHNWKKRAPDLPLPSLDELEKHIRKCLESGCYFSKTDLTESSFGIDHKIPLKRGGTHNIENLVVVAQEINKAKGDMTDEEFMSLLSLIRTWEDKGENLLKKLRASTFIYR